jgi:hypothetical protein
VVHAYNCRRLRQEDHGFEASLGYNENLWKEREGRGGEDRRGEGRRGKEKKGEEREEEERGGEEKTKK